MPLADFGSDDPIYANVAASVVLRGCFRQFDRGILICGTGISAFKQANSVMARMPRPFTLIFTCRARLQEQ